MAMLLVGEVMRCCEQQLHRSPTGAPTNRAGQGAESAQYDHRFSG
jgi:hypothetical protein